MLFRSGESDIEYRVRHLLENANPTAAIYCKTGEWMLVVSNFTLCADTRHGRRPSFTGAAGPKTADSLYLRFVAAVKDTGVTSVQTGRFGADMLVSIENDGPVTVILDTDEIMKRPGKV